MQCNELDACLSNLVHGPSGHGKNCMQQLSIGEVTHGACNCCSPRVNLAYHACAADPTMTAFMKVCVVGNSWYCTHSFSCTIRTMLPLLFHYVTIKFGMLVGLTRMPKAGCSGGDKIPVSSKAMKLKTKKD